MFPSPTSTTATRPASELERFRNGFGPTGETVCEWCGEEAAAMSVEGSFHEGQWFWSAARCSAECHTEAYGMPVE